MSRNLYSFSGGTSGSDGGGGCSCGASSSDVGGGCSCGASGSNVGGGALVGGNENITTSGICGNMMVIKKWMILLMARVRREEVKEDRDNDLALTLPVLTTLRLHRQGERGSEG